MLLYNSERNTISHGIILHSFVFAGVSIFQTELFVSTSARFKPAAPARPLYSENDHAALSVKKQMINIAALCVVWYRP